METGPITLTVGESPDSWECPVCHEVLTRTYSWPAPMIEHLGTHPAP